MLLFSKRSIKGFTLIELMIVITIIGILLAICIPLYSDYTKRTIVSEGFSIASGIKADVINHLAQYNECPDNNNGSDGGIPYFRNINGKYILYVKVWDEGKNNIRPTNPDYRSCSIEIYFSQNVRLDSRYANTSGILALQVIPRPNYYFLGCHAWFIDKKYLPTSCTTQYTTAPSY